MDAGRRWYRTIPGTRWRRMIADVFDDYVHAPMQRIVGNALRHQAERDSRGVADAHALMDRCYAWLEPRLQAKEWAACDRFTIADCAAAPALFYGDWVHPIAERHAALAAYRARFLSRPRGTGRRRGASLSALFPVGSARQRLGIARLQGWAVRNSRPDSDLRARLSCRPGMSDDLLPQIRRARSPSPASPRRLIFRSRAASQAFM